MGIFKYLLGVWAAIAVYTLLSFLGGAKGISSYNYLLAEREQQFENINELRVINEELENTNNNLIYSEDTLLVQARQMGYGYDDEKFVRIVGLENIKTTPAVTGKVYTVHDPDYLQDRNIKIAAICVGLLVFIFFFMMETIESKVR